MPESDVFTSIYRSRTLIQVAFYAAIVAIYAAIPVWKEHSEWKSLWDIPSGFHAAISVVLGWLLVFRTNTSHVRWWEARTLWGALVNASRNLAAKLSQLVELPQDELAEARRDLIAFAIALKDHLREGAAAKRLSDYDGEMLQANHLPAILVRRRYAALRRWKRSGFIDGDELRVIDADLSKLLDVCGACERIRNTRVIRSYRFFARQSVMIFLLTFPWGIVNDFDWWTIPITFLTAYFMLGLEIVAEHVEEPFGFDEDDLDLDRICKSIEQSVNEIMSPGVDSGGATEFFAQNPSQMPRDAASE